jgi:hypothetical protein
LVSPLRAGSLSGFPQSFEGNALPRRGFAALFPHHTKKILINVVYLLYAPPPPPPPVKRLNYPALSLFLYRLYF